MNDFPENIEGDSGGAAEPQREAAAALESTLDDLKQAIARIEAIAAELEAGEISWQESVELLAEVNQKATSCSQDLEQVVQDVIYRSSDELLEPGEEG